MNHIDKARRLIESIEQDVADLKTALAKAASSDRMAPQWGNVANHAHSAHTTLRSLERLAIGCDPSGNEKK